MRDRNERRHRRTWRNAACVETMAGADFGAVPSLAEAMGLETPMETCGYCGGSGSCEDGGKLLPAQRPPQDERPNAGNPTWA